MSAKTRIAVVGAGFGARIQVPGCRASGRFEVVALATFADGVACRRIMDAARAASAGGTWVPLPPLTM